jgi:hypothetical protein
MITYPQHLIYSLNTSLYLITQKFLNQNEFILKIFVEGLKKPHFQFAAKCT